jgi:hypothetical protein
VGDANVSASIGEDVVVPFAHRLSRTIDRARRTYAAWRPEVAEYLFTHGFRPAAEGLAGAPDREVILEHLWTLHLESIGTRMFGVSTDDWRQNPAYPDVYFPIVWLDVVPRLLPKLAPDKRLSTLAALFNLGENLVVANRALGGIVAQALVEGIDELPTEGPEPIVFDVLVDLGLVPKEAGKGRRHRRAAAVSRLETRAPFRADDSDPLLVPADVRFEGSVGVVVDARRPLALVFSTAGGTPQLVERRAVRVEVPVAAAALPHDGVAFDATVHVNDAGGISITPPGGEERRVGAIDPRGIVSVAISPSGIVAITRRFSQRVELHAIVP